MPTPILDSDDFSQQVYRQTFEAIYIENTSFL